MKHLQNIPRKSQTEHEKKKIRKINYRVLERRVYAYSPKHESCKIGSGVCEALSKGSIIIIYPFTNDGVATSVAKSATNWRGVNSSTSVIYHRNHKCMRML